MLFVGRESVICNTIIENLGKIEICNLLILILTL